MWMYLCDRYWETDWARLNLSVVDWGAVISKVTECVCDKRRRVCLCVWKQWGRCVFNVCVWCNSEEVFQKWVPDLPGKLKLEMGPSHGDYCHSLPLMLWPLILFNHAQMSGHNGRFWTFMSQSQSILLLIPFHLQWGTGQNRTALAYPNCCMSLTTNMTKT